MLDDIARDGREQGLPLVDAEVGALLRVLATAISATRILEIGTAIGYSGIWLAGALPPGGMLITMEVDQDRAREARDNFSRAGLADRANVMVGDAERMLAKVSGPFDLIFQDGDKRLYVPMLDRLIDLLRPRRPARDRQRALERRGGARASSIRRGDDTRMDHARHRRIQPSAAATACTIRGGAHDDHDSCRSDADAGLPISPSKKLPCTRPRDSTHDRRQPLGRRLARPRTLTR